MQIIDPHVHVAPDVEDRCTDAVGLARRGIGAGYAGFVCKSPASETATMAAITEAEVPGIRCWGGIVLNLPVGGLNAAAVESMFRVRGLDGSRHGKVVWMPTRNAENHVRAAGGSSESIVPLWEDGAGSAPRRELQEVIDVIAANDGVLATGHIGPAELLPLVKAAAAGGVDRIIITHVDMTVTLVPLDLQLELAAAGCYMEHCFAGLVIGPHIQSPWMAAERKPSSFEGIVESIRAVGASRSILSTDLGHVQLDDPIPGMSGFIARLEQAGIDEDSLAQMAYANSLGLLDA